MLETPHVIVGAAIAAKIANPALALPLAFGSHFLLEKVPHWNPHLNTETEKFGKPTKKSTKIVIIDATLATFGALYIAQRALPDSGHFITILAAGFAAALPDIIEGPYFFLNSRSAFIKRWILFQKSIQEDTTVVPGLLTQLATVVAAFWWILG
jgi:hypothetical protein